jgi:hypothetical protein
VHRADYEDHGCDHHGDGKAYRGGAEQAGGHDEISA